MLAVDYLSSFRPNEVDFVNNQRYLTGWLGKKRPLSNFEISSIRFNKLRTNL